MKKIVMMIVPLLLLVSCNRDEPEVPENKITSTDLTFNVKGVEYSMVLVEHGFFIRGEKDASVRSNPVYLTKDYYLGKSEVTQELWKAVMGNNPSKDTSDRNKPVENVSWDDCQTFLSKLNELTGRKFRLPTECEWEYAARAGVRKEPFSYSGSDNIDEVAWYKDNAENVIHCVCQKKANALGLYDMTGNVCEWCQDPLPDEPLYKGDTLYDPVATSAKPQYRVVKGAGFRTEVKYCNVSVLMCDEPACGEANRGLRLALTK